MIVKELQEIPETDENYQIIDDTVSPISQINFSDGNTSFNRLSPGTPGESKKMIFENRIIQRGSGVGIFGTITSSNNSNEN